MSIFGFLEGGEVVFGFGAVKSWFLGTLTGGAWGLSQRTNQEKYPRNGGGDPV